MTTAASTAFVSHRLELGDQHLFLDGNQKISGWENPKPNAFSLVQIKDCPGRTKLCEAACYVHNLEKHAPDTHALYRHNSETIRTILADSPRRPEWAARLGEWINANCRDVGFRWHVSGDIFAPEYAAWIGDVVAFAPDVQHWIYTRSFDHLWPLLHAPRLFNLTINLSCDQENYARAFVFAAEHARKSVDTFSDGRGPFLRLCYLTIDGSVPNDLPPGSVIFPDYKFRGDGPGSWFASLSPDHKKLVCPVDTFSKSATNRCGVCVKCIRPA